MIITSTLIHLAELHHAYGLIGMGEYRERIEVALWLGDDTRVGSRPVNDGLFSSEEDPNLEKSLHCELTTRYRSTASGTAQHIKPDDDLEFIFMGWHFTGADPDPFPSVPHGHLGSADREWPKLNPYTGWAFKDRRNEEKSHNLTRKQLIVLWGDRRFRSFCRERVVWYMQTFPKYKFSVHDPLRMPRY